MSDTNGKAVDPHFQWFSKFQAPPFFLSSCQSELLILPPCLSTQVAEPDSRTVKIQEQILHGQETAPPDF